MNIQLERMDAWFPFRVMLEKAQTSPFAELCRKLVSLGDEFNQAHHEMVLALSHKRKKRDRISPNQTKALQEMQNDAIKAEPDLVRAWSAAGSELEMLEMAWNSEKFELATWKWLYDSPAISNQPAGCKVRELRMQMIQEMEHYLFQHGGPTALSAFLDGLIPSKMPKTKKSRK